MSSIFNKSMVTLALAHAALATAEDCKKWKELTEVNYDCDANWQCTAKPAWAETLGSEFVAVNEKKVSKGGDDWTFKCDPDFFVLQKKLAETADSASDSSSSSSSDND